MKTKGRKLFRGMLGTLAAIVLMGVAYTTTVMASSIGMIDTADLLDIHAEADSSSEVVGQVMDEGHVAILAKGEGWVQIQAGDIVGWVPAGNLIEKEISNEEAVAANEEVIERQVQEAELESSQTGEQEEEESAQEEQTEAREEQMPESAPEAAAEADAEAEVNPEAEAEAFAREVAVSAQKADMERAQKEAEALLKAQQEAAAQAAEQARAQAEAAAEQARVQAEAAAAQARAQAEAAAQARAQAEAQLRAQQEEAARAAQAAAQAEAEKAAEAARRQAILNANGITEEELYLLANIIYCEAGCEPYIGKVAVGNVVMNRVKSSRQPDTIEGVIYAKGQFSPVKNGSLERALRRGSADESCYQAALEALSGAKPVGDKLFFRRVNGRPGQVIGHHVFY